MLAVKGRASMEVTPRFVAEIIGEGMYRPQELIDLELQVLRTLGWRLNGPTALDFIKHLMELLPTGHNKEVASSLYDSACKRVKMSLLDYQLALELPSSIALASIFSSVRDMNDEEQEQLCLSSWISRINFVMATSGLGNLVRH
jgi:hypothetical protein